MNAMEEELQRFFAEHHPFDLLDASVQGEIAAATALRDLKAGETLYAPGETLDALPLVVGGGVEIRSNEGQPIARLGPGAGFGERILLRGVPSEEHAVAIEPTRIASVPKALLTRLIEAEPDFAAFYRRPSTPPASGAETPDAPVTADLASVMTPNPITIGPDATAREAAGLMRARGISCVLVTGTDGRLGGILTTGDLTAKIVASGRDSSVPVAEIMTPNPRGLPPGGLVLDALLLMSELGIGHLPVVEAGRPVGILTRTNLTQSRASSAAGIVHDIGRADAVPDLARALQGVPHLLAQLVGGGAEAHKVAAIITGITDALTTRLLTLAAGRLGPAPTPYLWLACGSQGRREQTGVSDQDNCLILDDSYDEAAHGAYFGGLARFVCDGLDACGYVYCPGEMMAITPRWRQPVKVWRRYFKGWIDRPDPMAQMLSSVMFDLRPIQGQGDLFAGLQRETLRAAKANSIFRAHMIANSLKHTPPLGLFRGFALVKDGEGSAAVDLKHGGVTPIVDLARVYALDAGIEAVNTRERIVAAQEAGSLSRTGGDDLLDAYDFITDTRLKHQAAQVREGKKPDNFLRPSSLSALERKYLRDAFGVVKSLQSALGWARSAG